MRFLKVLALLSLLAPVAAFAGNDRQERIDRAWRAWLEASAEQSQASTGDVVYDARLGALLSASTGERRLKVVDLKAGYQPPLGCAGNSDLLNGAMFRAAIRELTSIMEDADQYLAALVRDAPGLALAYFKPEWAKAVKAFRRFTHQLMSFRANQCSALNKLIAKRLTDVLANEKHKCINRRGGGHSAMDRCGEGLIIEDPFWFLPKMPNPETGTDEYRPVEYALTKAFLKRGLSEKDANDYARIVTGMFGDLVFTHDEARSQTGSGEPGPGEGRRSRRGPGVMEGLRKLLSEKIEEWRGKAEALADKPGPESARAFRTHLTDVSPAQARALVGLLGREGARHFFLKLAEINAKLEALYSLRGYEDLYAEVAADQEAGSVKDKLDVNRRAMGMAARIVLGDEGRLAADFRRLLHRAMADAREMADRRAVEAELRWSVETAPR